MDNNAQPTFDTPSAMGGGPPDLGAPAQPQVQVQPQQAPAPQPSQQDIAVNHDTLFGRAAKTLMGGNMSYHVDQDGNTVAVRSPNSFQSFAKNVLAASLLGAAAGANGDARQGISGGIARGGAAAIGQQQQQDQLKRQQAEQDFKNEQNVQQADQQKLQSQATIAHMHALTANMQRTSDLADAELHQKNNASSRALEGVLIQAGGKLAPIPVDGEPSNGVLTAPQMAEAVVSNPNVMKAPEGYERHFLDTSDASDVKFNGKQWVQDDGTPVNMTDKTTIKAYDVPIDSLNTRQDLKGSVLLAANPSLKGTIDPDKTYPTTPSQVTALRASYMGEQQKQALVDQEKARTNIQRAQLGLESRRVAVEEKKEARESSQDSLGGSELSHLINPTNVGEDGVNHPFLDAVMQKDPRRAKLIQQVGEGRGVVSSFGLSRKEGQALQEYVDAAYPDYDQSKAVSYAKLRDSFTSGVDGKQVEAANTTMKHAGEFYDNSQHPSASIPKTTAYNNLATIRPQLVEEINSAYTKGVLDDHKRKELEEGLSSSIPWVRDDSVKQVMHLLADKVQEKQRTWQRGKPSRAIPDRDIISPEGQAAFQRVTGTSISSKGEFGKGTQSNDSQAARQPAALPQGNGGKIDATTATQFLQQAGGDKDKARQLAQQHGWSF